MSAVQVWLSWSVVVVAWVVIVWHVVGAIIARRQRRTEEGSRLYGCTRGRLKEADWVERRWKPLSSDLAEKEDGSLQ